MKTYTICKYFAFISLFIVITACSSDEPTLKIDNSLETPSIKFIKRTPEQAIDLVRSLSENNKPVSRSDESALQYKKAVDESSLQVVGNAKSRSGGFADTLIYAVNYSNNEGFVLVSANVDTEPILAIVDQGSFDENRTTDNEPFEAFLSLAKGYVLNSSGGGPPITPGNPDPDHLILMWKSDTISSFSCQEPRVKVQWGQGWPANIYCPNKVAGCAPLAIAQALTLTRTISQVDLWFPERDVVATLLNWDNIVKHKNYNMIEDPLLINGHINNCDATSKTHNDIGRLVRQLGLELNSTYFLDDPEYGTQTSTTIIGTVNYPNVINKYFSGKSITRMNSLSSAYNQISSFGSVALVSAWNKGFDKYGNVILVDGHTWIADATAHITRFVMTYYNYDTVTGEYTHKESTTLQDDRFIHFNWGWNGFYDGYYLLSVLKWGNGFSTVTRDTFINPDMQDNYYQYKQDVYVIK